MTDAVPPRPPLPSASPPPSAYPPPPSAYPQPSAYPPPSAYPGFPGHQGAAPSPAYSPPPGYPARPPQSLAQPAFGGPLPTPARRGTLGVVALVLGILAAVGAAVVVSIAAFQIGLGTGKELANRPLSSDFDWSVLSPVRDWVLLGEVAFWTGTVLGLWALAQGVVAIVSARGRGFGIAAVAVAVFGPVLFVIAVNVFLTAGFAAGSGIGG
ncbi:hypothetical protein AAIB33_09045 [Microbacterium sp. AZCO]|uniref:hypothetical protein n=1 Tax=Microbacterium sp. AZCO TaxID=3142976 RepID=UPI0031F3D8AB